jgi:NADP-dependent 3-hydroxy acid dehydrogenase YdfG
MVDKLAIVTGASRGIGATIAKELSENGFIVLLLARHADGLNQVAGYLQAEGGAAHAIPADISKKEDVAKVIEFVKNFNGELALLVHNAGIAKVGKLENMSLEDWQKTLDINLTGPFLLTQGLLPYIRENGQIIFINSVSGKQTFPEWGAYSTTKFGLRAFAETLRQEVAQRNIRVTSIYPASVNTGMHDELPYDWDRNKMMKAIDIAYAVIYCIKQRPNIQINEIDLANIAGTF